MYPFHLANANGSLLQQYIYVMMMRSAESSSSSATATDESKNINSRSVGVWLSLNYPSPSPIPAAPKSYQCSLCSRSFLSVQALGGHQNAHRKEKNAMHKMYMDILRNLKHQHQHPPRDHHLVHSTPHATSSLQPIPPHHQPEIDLDLALSCGPSSPKLKYYHFI
ncbi:hypothetical protein L6164_021742 [Bauhinia variegata]|uniref:Uncharacterized protein n=1 Tax=Bauhinia variegata TaxID=167791 RepID=A0ACB9MEB7_BAUVA|nr:hypothetical protein L6164_021742 [Bauhinia variegata]